MGGRRFPLRKEKPGETPKKSPKSEKSDVFLLDTIYKKTGKSLSICI